VFTDRLGNLLYISPLHPVNRHDGPLFEPALRNMMAGLEERGIRVRAGTPINLDAGFDSKANRKACQDCQLQPNIKCNPRNSGQRAAAPNEAIYVQRYVNERAFAWEDTYRRLVIRYEVYARNHLAFTYMAASLTLLRLVT